MKQKKLQHEAKRLFYVAATRAKKSLHLLTEIDYDEKKHCFKTPPHSSFAEMLWNKHQDNFITHFLRKKSETNAENNILSPPQLTRLKICWENPLNLNIQSNEKKHTADNHLDLHFVKNAQHLGTVLHEALQYIATQGIRQFDHQRIAQLQTHWKKRLLQLGVNFSQLEKTSRHIQQLVYKTLSDPIGQWILSEHQESKCEFPVTALLNNKPTQCIIDRTFVDEQGVRWIIDYKTSSPSNESTAEFLEKEKACYTQQLNQYAQAFLLLERRAIKLALYFPACQQHLFWNYDQNLISAALPLE